MNEQEREREWLGELTSLDLTDLSFGTFDLSRGSTKEWWEQVEEIPMATFLEREEWLKKVRTEELEAELKMRKELLDKPKSKTAINPDPLIELCEQYVNEAWDNDYEDEDLPHYIFEAAMEAVFGEGIFDKIRIHRQRKNK